MSVLKTKKNGVWIDAVSSILDADTLDGRHANEFASISSVENLNEKLLNIDSETKKIAQDVSIIKNGMEDIIVTITRNDDETYSADKSFSEVYAAGYKVRAVWRPNDTDSYIFNIISRNEGAIYFQSDALGQSSIYFRIYSDDTIEMLELQYETAKPIPVSVASTKDRDNVTVTTTYEDSSTEIVTITLDSNEYPISVVKNGNQCVLTWDGFS